VARAQAKLSETRLQVRRLLLFVAALLFMVGVGVSAIQYASDEDWLWGSRPIVGTGGIVAIAIAAARHRQMQLLDAAKIRRLWSRLRELRTRQEER
jgi:hypothetical protein